MTVCIGFPITNDQRDWGSSPSPPIYKHECARGIVYFNEMVWPTFTSQSARLSELPADQF